MIPTKLCEIEQIKKDYIDNDGLECPNPSCHSDSFTSGFVEGSGGLAFQKCFCDECDWEWTEVYKLVNVEIG